MTDVIQANWLAFVVALLIGLLVAWWLFGRATSAPPRSHRPDVLDEGTAPAQRNQALIDAAPAAVFTAAVPDILGGIGQVIAVGAQDVVEEAQAAAQEPEPEPDPAPTPGDDLSRIKGVGPKLQALLPTLGLGTYARIAALSEADLAELDPKLGAFAGRAARDNWIEQAKLLAAGDVAGFEAKFGKV